MNNITLSILFFLSILFHFLIQKIFIKYNRFDDFNHRSSHKTLATRTGGIGVFSIMILISLYYYFKGEDLFDYSIFIPIGIMFIVGVYDDFYKADFKLKFFLQIIVAKILIDQGLIIDNYFGLFGVYEVPRFLAQMTTIFVFLIIINSINFIDGIDGLALTEVLKILFFIEFFSESRTPYYWLFILLIFSSISLYYFNFKKKKKIFLGDGGSLLLGTIVSIFIFYSLRDDYTFKQDFNINKFLFSIIVLHYPLLDLLRVFVIRIKKGNSPFIADNNHFHHKINSKLNGNHFKTLITIQLISIVIFIILSTIARQH